MNAPPLMWWQVVRPANGHIETYFYDGTVCHGDPQSDAGYFATAAELGYGDDVKAMAWQNDLLHARLCERAGLPFCPVLWGTAHNRWWFLWNDEDNAVLALQALLCGRSVEELPPYRREALVRYITWTRPKTTVDALVAEARAWIDLVDSNHEPASA